MGPIAARSQNSCSESTGAGWMSSLPTYAVTWIAKIQLVVIAKPAAHCLNDR